jgi:hypothetical protein
LKPACCLKNCDRRKKLSFSTVPPIAEIRTGTLPDCDAWQNFPLKGRGRRTRTNSGWPPLGYSYRGGLHALRSAIGHALANPGGKIYRVLRERDMVTPEIVGRIFGIRRQPPPWSLPGVGYKYAFRTLLPVSLLAAGYGPAIAQSTSAAKTMVYPSPIKPVGPSSIKELANKAARPPTKPNGKPFVEMPQHGGPTSAPPK